MNYLKMTGYIVRTASDNWTLGYEGENNARTLRVKTTDDLTDFATVNLLIDTLDCGAMTVETVSNYKVLSMVLTAAMLGEAGKKTCQLLMMDSGGTVIKKTNQFYMVVCRSNVIEGAVPDSPVITIISDYVEEKVDELLDNFTIATDTTLTQAGTPADAKSVGDAIILHTGEIEEIQSDVSEVKDDLGDLDIIINGESSYNFLEEKNINTSGAIIDDPTRCVSEKIPYTWTGSTRYYNGNDTSMGCRIAFYDAGDNLLNSFQAPGNTNVAYRAINAETQVTGTVAYVRFSWLKDYTAKVTANASTETPVYWSIQAVEGEGLLGTVEDIQTEVNGFSEGLADIEEKTLVEVTVTEEVDDITWTSGCITLGGNVKSSDTYVYSTSIGVAEGDVIKTASQARFITAYNSGSAVESKGVENNMTYTVPEGVDAVVITLTMTLSRQVTRGEKVKVNSLTPRVEALESSVSASGVFRKTASSVTDGTVTALADVATRKNQDIDFRGNVSSFTSVTVGHGYQINYGVWVVVDNTNVTVYANSGGEQVGQYAHGLTIGHYLHVLIQQGTTKATVIVETDSGRFKQENVTFDSRRGDFFATITGTMTNVSVSAVLHDLSKKTWLFGDSYQSIGDPKRYPYYLQQDGYLDNVLMCGFPGANASGVYGSFQNLVKAATPQRIVWTLGMNGADTSTAVNASWKNVTDEVIEYCTEKGIDLILATVPNVPDRLHTFKNAYVISTGLRYVDFAKAVGAESAGSTWYTGMLSTDNVHPDTAGAIALYSQLLADVPEIANK